MRIAYNPLYKPDGKTKVGALTSAPINDIVFDLPGKSIWAKGLKFLGTDSLKIIIGSSSDTVAGTWTGQHSEIGRYEDGLTIIYIPKVAGASTTTLNINGLGAKTCYYSGNSKLTTHYPAGTPILFTYYNDGWRRADYDASTVNYRPIKINDTLLGNDNYILNFKSDSNISYVTTTTSNLTNLTIGINILNLKNNLGVSTIINSASTNDLLPTSKSVYDFVGTYLTSYMHWKGNTPSSGTTFTIPSTAAVGDTYRIAVAGTIPVVNSATGTILVVEVGDIIICTDSNGPKYTVALTNWTTLAGTSALAWNSEVTLATIGGLEIKAKLPINPTSLLQSISFTKADGTAVSYNGSVAVDLTGGINYATLANLVKNNLIIKWGAGDTEGTNLFTYNGSTAKTINLSTPFSQLFTNFSNAGSLTTRITIGGITKDLKIDADLLDGLHETSFYRYRGNYNKSYTAASTEYNLGPGTYITSESGYSGTLLSFNSGGSASALQFWTHYLLGYLYYRTSIDSNRWGKTDGAWTRILDSDNYTLYCATSNHNHDGKYLRKDTNDSTPYQYTFTKTDDHAIRVGTIRGTTVGSQIGEYIHLYERVAIGSPYGWGTRPAPSYGLSTYGGALLATDTGNVTIGGTNLLSSTWGSFNLTVGNDTDKVVIGYLNSSTNGVVVGGHNNGLSAWAPLNIAGTTLYFRINEIIKATLDFNGNFGIGITPGYKLDVNGDTRILGNLLVGANASNNYIAFYGNTGDNPGYYQTSFIGEHLWGSPESTELLLMKFNDIGNGADATTVYSSGPDRIRHLAHGHVFQIMTDTSQGDFITMANSSAVETKFDIARYQLHAYAPLAIISDGSNSGYDALAYMRHYSNNDWGLIVDKSQSYTYGVDIRAGGEYALKVGNGNTRLIGATIIGADATPSYTLDVRGHIRATENLIVSTNNTTGGGIIFADDGDIVDLNDAYCTMRFTSGIRITNANRGGGVVQELNVNGKLYNYGLYHYSYGSSDYFLTSDGGARYWPNLYDGRYLRYEGWWSDGSGQNVNDSLGMNFTYVSHGAPHHWGTTVTFEASRNSGYRLQLHGTGDNYLFFRNRSSDYGGWHSSGWKQILTNQDTYVASDGTNRGIINGTEVASARHLLINGVTWNSNWHWSGQSGLPTYLWGSNDGSNMYVWNPSNFRVDKARGLFYSGTGTDEITAHQTPDSYFGRSGWATYIIGNHGSGASYYHQIIAMPFWGMPQYQRMEGGTNTSWYTFAMMDYANAGNLYAAHFYENSDIRQKTDLSPLNISIKELSIIPLFNFSWKEDLSSRNTGTSAQAVQSILPNLVTESGDYLKLDYGVLGTIAGITACKELVNLKSEIEILKDRIELLEQQLKMYHGNSK